MMSLHLFRLEHGLCRSVLQKLSEVEEILVYIYIQTAFSVLLQIVIITTQHSITMTEERDLLPFNGSL